MCLSGLQLDVRGAASAGERVLMDQGSFPAKAQSMAKVAYGLGEHSTDHTVVSVRDLWHYSAKPQLKSYANGMPSAYSLRSGKGQMMLAPEVENFRMRFAASNVNKPCVEFRWRAESECYQLDLAEGVLRRISGDAQVVLARGGSPWFAGAETPESWSAFEVAVQGGTIQVRVSKDGKTWEPGLNGVDKHPIGTGAVMLRSERPAQGVFVAFGDLQVVALPGGAAVRGRRAVGTEYREAFLTSMDYLPRDPDSRQARARIQALDYLGCLEAPVPAEVSTALAVAQSDRDLGIRLAALRASRRLGLALDVPRLLMAGLCSVDATVRVGSVRGLVNLKAAPEAIQSKVVDGLIADSRFVRFDMKRLVKEMGAPLRSAVLSEIQSRYAEAKSSGVKAALLRALGRDGADEKPLVEGLGLLTEALGDPAPEVRLAAVRTLRWIESPLAWQERANVGETIFRGKPEETSSITARLKAMLERDPSLALRAEALGCLAEMRAAPGDIHRLLLRTDRPSVLCRRETPEPGDKHGVFEPVSDAQGRGVDRPREGWGRTGGVRFRESRGNTRAIEPHSIPPASRLRKMNSVRFPRAMPVTVLLWAPLSDLNGDGRLRLGEYVGADSPEVVERKTTEFQGSRRRRRSLQHGVYQPRVFSGFASGLRVL
jgi:hypothetical protein